MYVRIVGTSLLPRLPCSGMQTWQSWSQGSCSKARGQGLEWRYIGTVSEPTSRVFHCGCTYWTPVYCKMDTVRGWHQVTCPSCAIHWEVAKSLPQLREGDIELGLELWELSHHGTDIVSCIIHCLNCYRGSNINMLHLPASLSKYLGNDPYYTVSQTLASILVKWTADRFKNITYC